MSEQSPSSSKSPRIEIRLRNNGMLEAGTDLKPGQALAPYMVNRRGAIRLHDVFWRETGRYVDHLTLLEHEIVWARPLDTAVPVTNVALTPGGTMPQVAVVLTTGQTLEGRFALIRGQGISEFLGTAGPFPVLRDARLPDGRRLGDVVVSVSAVRSVREGDAGTADVWEPAVVAERGEAGISASVHWLLSLAQRSGGYAEGSLALPPATPALDVWWALCAAGPMSQDVIARMIAEHLRLPLASDVTVDAAAQSVIPTELARRYGVRALSDDGRQLLVATIDPMDANAEQALSFACKRRVGFAVATPDWLGLKAVSSDPETELETLLAKMPSLTTDLVQIEEELDPQGVTAGEVTSEPIIKLCNLILREAVRQSASDVHLEPDAGRGLIRFRVDGVLRQYMHVPLAALSRVISRFKILGKLDIADRVRPQDGRVRVRIDNRALDLRLSTVPTQDAEKAVIRIAGAVQEQTLDQLEVPEQELMQLRQLLGHRDGIIIVTGPTGSGKTTTLYAALSELNTGRVNIMTVEDPIERALAGATQIQVDPRRGVTFASALRAVLRQDPDVILVGEIRDLETAEIALQAATTGHLVLATLHTTTAVGVIERLRDLGVDRTSLAGSLRGVVGQRLARRICADCSGDGCMRCEDSGYRGRIPIMEVLTATPAFAELIGRGASFHELGRAARAQGMRTMHDVAAQRIADGVTTQAEINRAIGAGDADDIADADIIELTEADVSVEPQLRTPADTAPATHVPALHMDAGQRRAELRADAVRTLLQGIDRCVAEGQAVEDLLRFACSQLSGVFESPLVWAALDDDEALSVRARAGACSPWCSDLLPDLENVADAASLVGTALRTGTPQGCHIAQDDVDPVWRENARLRGVPIFLAIPMNTTTPVNTDAAAGIGIVGMHVRSMDVLDAQAGAEVVHIVERIGAAVQRLRELHATQVQLAAFERAADAVQQMVTMDPLTRLPNARAFETALSRSIAAVADGAPEAALLLIRIDGGCALREDLGPAVADARVVQVAAALTHTLRPGDVLARLSDDEFAALLPGTPLDGAGIVVERVNEVMAGWAFTAGPDDAEAATPPTVTIGVAPVDGTETARAVIAMADTALYGPRDRHDIANTHGGTAGIAGMHRGPVSLAATNGHTGAGADAGQDAGQDAGPGATERQRADEEWARRIRTALDDEQFVLYFQPVMRLRTGSVSHYDALIRLHDDDGDVIPARAFITHAENVGLMPRIDQWVLENALRLLRTSPDLRISMNLSATTVTSPVFRQFLQKQHRRMKAVGARLIFEVEEVAAARDLPRMIASMQRLSELGCRFALDNFGLAASSVASLGALPVDYVKLDGTLVSGVEDDGARAELVRALVTVVRALGREVIAGCAERQSTVNALPLLGIELAQGHCLGRPTPELARDGRSFMTADRPEAGVPFIDALPACRLESLVA